MVMHFTGAKITVVADSCFCSKIVHRSPVETLMLLFNYRVNASQAPTCTS
jgi:hypothetical protein